MKRTIRLLVVCAGLTVAAGTGSSLAYADAGEGSAQAQPQAQAQQQSQQGKDSHEKHLRHHRHHCKRHRHHECCCDRKGEHHGWGRHERFAELTEKLGLSDAQKAKVKDVFTKNRPQIKPNVTKLTGEKREMRTLIQSGSADEAAIRAEAAKVAAIEADLAVQRAQMAKQLRAILTPEQIEKFKALQKERDRRIDEYRERMGGKFDGPGEEK